MIHVLTKAIFIYCINTRKKWLTQDSLEWRKEWNYLLTSFEWEQEKQVIQIEFVNSESFFLSVICMCVYLNWPSFSVTQTKNELKRTQLPIAAQRKYLLYQNIQRMLFRGCANARYFCVFNNNNNNNNNNNWYRTYVVVTSILNLVDRIIFIYFSLHFSMTCRNDFLGETKSFEKKDSSAVNFYDWQDSSWDVIIITLCLFTHCLTVHSVIIFFLQRKCKLFK